MGAMTLGVLDSTNLRLPLSVQLFLVSDRLEFSPSAGVLAAAVALISLAIGLSTL